MLPICYQSSNDLFLFLAICPTHLHFCCFITSFVSWSILISFNLSKGLSIDLFVFKWFFKKFYVFQHYAFIIHFVLSVLIKCFLLWLNAFQLIVIHHFIFMVCFNVNPLLLVEVLMDFFHFFILYSNELFFRTLQFNIAFVLFLLILKLTLSFS